MNVDEFIRTANQTFDFSELEKLTEIGEKLLKILEDGHDKGRVYGTLGNIYYALQKFDSAEDAYLKALQIYLKLAEDDESYMRYAAGCLFNLGNLYQVRKKYEDAEKAYSDALKVLEYVSDEQQKAAILSALGTMYAKLGVYERAEKVLMEAFEVAKKFDPRQAGAVLNNLAVIYARLGRRKEAEILLKKALDMLDEFGRNVDVASVLQNLLPFLDDVEIGDVLKKLEKFDLPYDLAAKVKYFKAKRLEKDGKMDDAAVNYLEAACLGFLAYRKFGLQSVNFIHCLDKVCEISSELASKAETLKQLIMKYYFGANIELNLDNELGKAFREYLAGKELKVPSALAEVLQVIGNDFKTFRKALENA